MIFNSVFICLIYASFTAVLFDYEYLISSTNSYTDNVNVNAIFKSLKNNGSYNLLHDFTLCYDSVCTTTARPGLLSYTFVRLAYLLRVSLSWDMSSKDSKATSTVYLKIHRRVVYKHHRINARHLQLVSQSCNAIVLSIILLSGDIQLNPSQSTFVLNSLPVIDHLQPSDLQLIQTPSDGHCLFHAIHLSLHHKHKLHLPVQFIINATRHELLARSADYIQFGFPNVLDYQRQIDRYLTDKIYNDVIGDLMLMAIANALNVRIIIVDDIIYKINQKTIIIPQSSVPDDKYIIVHLRAEHYSAINFNALKYLSASVNQQLTSYTNIYAGSHPSNGVCTSALVTSSITA